MTQASPRRRSRWRLRRRSAAAADASMTVMEHLGELRTRLVISLVAFVALSAVVFAFYGPILDVLRRPYCSLPDDLLGPQGCRLIFTSPLEAFQFRLKLTALFGLAFASPVWLYQVWAFVVPALTPRERNYALPFMFSSVLLFLAGTALAYYSLPTGMRVLFSLGGPDLVSFITADHYLNFVGLMLIAFGATFELPLLLFFLGLAEVVSVQQLKRFRRAAVVGIVALSAVITPSQDPYTMLILAIPLYVLYEVTILVLARALRRRERT